jgi:hypothetical protein
MIGCNVCGDYEAWYRYDKFQILCVACCKETPIKVARRTFDPLYWGEKWGDIPTITRKAFYSDYLTSRTPTVEQYRTETTQRECRSCGTPYYGVEEICNECIAEQQSMADEIAKDNRRMNEQRDRDIVSRHNHFGRN